jgi:S-adenosylmethionine:tRNA ribosyltransferase-isomerase
LDQVSDYYYELPEELIAQEPLAERSASRMLVVSRDLGRFEDDEFANFARYIRPGDCLVLNDTRVFPARLHGHRNHANGAAVEVFLIRAEDGEERVWRVLVRPAKRVHLGDRIILSEDFSAEVLGSGQFGERTVRLHSSQAPRQLFESLGEVPLPPYIHRSPSPADRERYQTVFAAHSGSVAAPTAGLHFTPQILEQCQEVGADLAYVTLHVGLGTFAPLREKLVSDIRLHEEYFEIAESEMAKIRRAKRVFCVGTTSVRTVETLFLRAPVGALKGETNLFISPGYRFRATGAMLTNFHLPASSLLLLVCAFGGKDLILSAYAHAVKERYRFFSYGDCMLIQ